MRPAPSRTCVVCRTTRPKRELLRIVRMPDGRVIVDESGRAAGRGAYLCADPACRRARQTRGALERALETDVPPELLTMLDGDDTQLTTAEGGARGQE